MSCFYPVMRTIGALMLGVSLASCESLGDIETWFDTKKPLPGERKPVFAEGVPGVPKGIPPELVRGYQAPPEAEPSSPPDQPAAAPPPEKPKPRPRPATAAAQPRQPPTSVTVQPSSSASRSAWPAPPAPGEQPSQQTPQWPSPAQNAPPAPTPWPAAPPPGTFSR